MACLKVRVRMCFGGEKDKWKAVDVWLAVGQIWVMIG